MTTSQKTFTQHLQQWEQEQYFGGAMACMIAACFCALDNKPAQVAIDLEAVIRKLIPEDMFYGASKHAGPADSIRQGYEWGFPF